MYAGLKRYECIAASHVSGFERAAKHSPRAYFQECPTLLTGWPLTSSTLVQTSPFTHLGESLHPDASGCKTAVGYRGT